MLSGVLMSFLAQMVDRTSTPCTRAELLSCAQRLFRSIALVQQITTEHYLRILNERIQDRENQLRGFNRTVSHELKNRIGALQNASELLGSATLAPDRRTQLQRIVLESTRDITQMIDNLTRLSHFEASLVKHDVPLRQAAQESVATTA